jgi:hypothetical protein
MNNQSVPRPMVPRPMMLILPRDIPPDARPTAWRNRGSGIFCFVSFVSWRGHCGSDVEASK